MLIQCRDLTYSKSDVIDSIDCCGKICILADVSQFNRPGIFSTHTKPNKAIKYEIIGKLVLYLDMYSWDYVYIVSRVSKDTSKILFKKGGRRLFQVKRKITKKHDIEFETRDKHRYRAQTYRSIKDG